MPPKKRLTLRKKSPAITQRSKNHKTAVNPWEASRDEDYEVEKIEAKRWVAVTSLVRAATIHVDIDATKML